MGATYTVVDWCWLLEAHVSPLNALSPFFRKLTIVEL